MEQLPEFLLADSTEHPESIFVIHTVFPRFVINLQNDEIEWWEFFTAEDKEIATQEVAPVSYTHLTLPTKRIV